VIKLLPEERHNVAQYIHSICAIALDQSKDYLIESRLSALMEETRCESFSQLVSRSKADSNGSLKRRIIDEITTNETLFFRDSSPFDLLRFKMIPEIIDRRSRSGLVVPIRIWSAACSTGQEVYSIAIILKELLGNLGKYNIRLLGTDISDQAVARASEGVFSQVEIARGLSDAARAKSFLSHAKGWKVCDEIRAMTSFRRLNLMEDFSSLGTFDIVFCRNVAIYFSEPDRVSLFNRIGQRLENEGSLVIGAQESLHGLVSQFESKRHLRSVYYQLKKRTDSSADSSVHNSFVHKSIPKPAAR
jgi:chemotaxis protein methyltransferase CheR